ncbi:hypothetical protein AVEN_36629-1, partial [Araneus ventricosus]
LDRGTHIGPLVARVDHWLLRWTDGCSYWTIAYSDWTIGCSDWLVVAQIGPLIYSHWTIDLVAGRPLPPGRPLVLKVDHWLLTLDHWLLRWTIGCSRLDHWLFILDHCLLRLVVAQVDIDFHIGPLWLLRLRPLRFTHIEPLVAPDWTTIGGSGEPLVMDRGSQIRPLSLLRLRPLVCSIEPLDLLRLDQWLLRM